MRSLLWALLAVTLASAQPVPFYSRSQTSNQDAGAGNANLRDITGRRRDNLVPVVGDQSCGPSQALLGASEKQGYIFGGTCATVQTGAPSSTVTTSSPITGDGSTGSPVTLSKAVPTNLINLSTVPATGSCTLPNVVTALNAGAAPTCAQPTSVTGNAATATALAAAGSTSPSGFVARGVDASGNSVNASVDSAVVGASTNPIQGGAVSTALALKVNKAGDTMTGALTVNAPGASITANGGVVGSSGSFTNGVTASSGTFLATGNGQFSVAASSGVSIAAGTLKIASIAGANCIHTDASGGLVGTGSDCGSGGGGGGTSTQTVTWVKDDFLNPTNQANGTTKSFNLSNTPSSTAAVSCILDGLVMGASDYTFTMPTTVAMTTAPSSNSTGFFCQYTVNTSTLPAAFILNSTQTVSGANTNTGQWTQSSGSTLTVTQGGYCAGLGCRVGYSSGTANSFSFVLQATVTYSLTWNVTVTSGTSSLFSPFVCTVNGDATAANYTAMLQVYPQGYQVNNAGAIAGLAFDTCGTGAVTTTDYSQGTLSITSITGTGNLNRLSASGTFSETCQTQTIWNTVFFMWLYRGTAPWTLTCRPTSTQGWNHEAILYQVGK